jgi:DNA-binding transcriptional LysR family regulator
MANHGEAMLAIAKAAMGIMLQPLELVRAELDVGRLVRVLPEYSAPTRPMHILYAPDRRLTPKLRSFIDFAVGTFGRETGMTASSKSCST